MFVVSDCKQFHHYQQNQLSPQTIEHKKTATYEKQYRYKQEKYALFIDPFMVAH